jgi:hypothetical protein
MSDSINTDVFSAIEVDSFVLEGECHIFLNEFVDNAIEQRVVVFVHIDRN